MIVLKSANNKTEHIYIRGKPGETYIDTAVKMITSILLGGALITGFSLYFNPSLIKVPVNQLNIVYSNSSNKDTYHEAVVDKDLLSKDAMPDDINPAPAVYNKNQHPDSPSPPTNLKASQTNQDIEFHWSPPISDGDSPITSYVVYLDGNKVATTDENTNLYIFSGKARGTHTLSVSSVNEVGESAKASIAYTSKINLPSEPTGVDATNQNGTVTIKWDSPDSDGGGTISEYKVYQEDSLIASTTGHSTSISGLSAGDYDFKVSAVNEAGEGPSAWVSITVTTIPGMPETVTASVPKDYNNALSINWTPPKDSGGCAVLGYNVYLNGKKANDTLIGGTTYYADKLMGDAYSVSVSAVNAVGEGPKAFCNEQFEVISAPSKPQNLNIVFNHKSKTLDITWTNSAQDGNSPISGYNVYVNEKKQNSSPIETSSSGQGEYIAQNIGYSDYIVQIKAVNSMGESEPEERYVITKKYNPSSPTNFNIYVDDLNNSAVLSWNGPKFDGNDDVTGYDIYCNGSVIASVDNTTTSYSMYNLDPGTYNVAVSAINSVGTYYQASNTFSISLKTPPAPNSVSASIAKGYNGRYKLIVNWDRVPFKCQVTKYIITINNSCYSVDSSKSSCETSNIPSGNVEISVAAENASGKGDLKTNYYRITTDTNGIPQISSS